MKLLTFMQLAETQSEISFEEIMSQLNLKEEEVEFFVIDRKVFYKQKKMEIWDMVT
ncbi:Eukaryotic translation initiation factor 3 subunit M [Caligus rogercresseyi]|uniref:Eukaryotic translation initiation factor 3 subunit M n=1 Tax=Caligus rogercresseyi TaxID=217165 RepID=A0A7T8GXK2_CALRO|nr:Eukaryotic translation initiation factor 3 subunit M [Caligus rogercresseyi]